MPSEKEFVTMSMLKEMLDLQQKSFKATIEVLVDRLKSEIKEIRKEQEELKLSVKFCSGKYEDSKKSLEKVDTEITSVYAQIKSINKELNEGFEDLEWKNEYLQNQSRRNDIKITGVPEGEEEKTWDDTEAIVKNLISDKLGIEEEVEIERAHRVGKKQRNFPPRRHDGSASQEHRAPRPIIAKIQSWKTKEHILRVARKKKPRGVVFMGDFSKRTLEGRRSKILDMIEARRNGKTAFMVMDQLVIFDKPRVTNKSLNDTDDEVTLSDKLRT